MLTPSSVAAHLMRRAGIARALILGSRGVGEVLAESGIEITLLPGTPHLAGCSGRVRGLASWTSAT